MDSVSTNIAAAARMADDGETRPRDYGAGPFAELPPRDPAQRAEFVAIQESITYRPSMMDRF